MYHGRDMTMKEIADELHVSVGSVYNYIKRHGIKSGRRLREFARKRMSEERKGKPSPLKGRHLSEEHKRKMSLTKKGKLRNPSKYGGHRKKRCDGYIYVYKPDHPYCSKEGYVMEHILVMEESIGRYITRDYVVHHINGIRDDNRIDNVKLMTFKEHAGFHMKERHRIRREMMTYQ